MSDNKAISLNCFKQTKQFAATKGVGAASAHLDDDDAGLGDDLLGHVLEDGVGVVFEGLELLHPVVQLDEGSEVLALRAAHRRRAKLDDRVVLLVGLLSCFSVVVFGKKRKERKT